MKKLRAVLFICLAATVAVSVTADDKKPARVKYVAPTGFAEHKWDELLSTFTRLPQEPASVGAAWTKAVMTDISFQCVPGGGMEAQTCDPLATLRTVRKKFEGGGFYVLSEYRIESQGYRFGENGVLLYPVLYQFCANWDETKRDVPPDFDQLNKFCGMRMLFKSETREQLRSLPGDHETNYDRVLDNLIDKFGKPDGFLRRGRVVIETLEGDSDDPRDRQFSIWRWCPAKDRGLHTGCDASVTLAIEPITGRGTVLFSTPLLWEYAYARENGAFKGDPLFRMLHARPEKRDNHQFRMN